MRTRREEVRAAMAVVARLRDHGVPIRDIVVVARDLDPYEEPLRRAAVRRGLIPTFWTQCRLSETRLFRLLEAVCTLLATPTPDRDTFFAPLELGWVPPEPDDGATWPILATTVTATTDAAPETSMSVEDWYACLARASWADQRIVTFAEWVAIHSGGRPTTGTDLETGSETRADSETHAGSKTQGGAETDTGSGLEPTPDAVERVLGGLVERYQEWVLPHDRATDGPALLRTETASRAVVRLGSLVAQVRRKYARRRREGQIASSWEAVAGLCRSIAQQRPGRREHANARALDIFETNDVWAREVPYVVAVGCVDGVWPSSSASTVPRELQQAIIDGVEPARRLLPRIVWANGRDRDQFVETVQAATRGLVFTRYTHDHDGVPQERSPLLDHLDVESVRRAARRRLVSADPELPDAIRRMLPGDDQPSSRGMTA
ncbi:MAG: hypothetical protein ABEH66_07865 [Halobacteriales archaeon]